MTDLITVPYVDVEIELGMMSRATRQVLAHEIPFIIAANGEEKVTVLGASGITKDLDPEDEWERLAARYGAAPQGAGINDLFGRRMEGRMAELMSRSMGMFPDDTPPEVADNVVEPSTPEVEEPVEVPVVGKRPRVVDEE